MRIEWGSGYGKRVEKVGSGGLEWALRVEMGGSGLKGVGQG